MATNQQKLDETWEAQGRVEAHVAAIRKTVEWLASPDGRAALLTHGIQNGDGKGVTSIAHSVRYSEPRSEGVRKEVVAARAETAALRELVAQLAGSQGAAIDYEKVGQASTKAIAEYVKSVETTTTTVNLKEAA